MKPYYVRNTDLKLWIVKHLPKWIVYYSLVVAGASASTGQYSDTNVTELTIIEVMKRWEAEK